MRLNAAITGPGAILRALCVLAVAPTIPLHAQTYHSVETGREIAIGGMGVAFLGFGAWQADRNQDRVPPVVDLATIPMFDRVATRQWSLPAHHASNVLFGVALGASIAVSIVNQNGEQPLLPVAIIAESGLLSAGLTNTVKELVRRPRPYLYNPDAPPGAVKGEEDYVSFWSGHTANTAAMTFSCASMVQRSDASPGLKTATWIGAAVAPAAMGYLRVKAGRHFPTDVLTGYAVGALVGLAVPYFHRAEKGAFGN
ncbi:MAG: phosphatase PAP2 family protein [Flavobacteriales bacterium]